MADNFSRLKKDLLFHERRMQLLLSTAVVEDLTACLAEKTQVRTECAADCKQALNSFTRGAAEPRLSGRWDELKVATLFKLEVPLRYVVGTNKFEAPEGQETRLLEELIQRLEAMSQRYPEFAHDDSRANSETLLDFVRRVSFTGRDVSRMRDAVSAKLELISELDDLTSVLQDSGFTLGRLRADLEDLRKQELEAKLAGEVAVSEALVRKRIDVLGRVIDATFFQTHTIDSTIESNVTKRNSHTAQFQAAAAMLECMKSEKRELAAGCAHDEGRIDRGMLFEAGAKDSGRGKLLDEQKASAARITALDERQEKLSRRLKELFEEFAEVEGALKQVGEERAKAVASHVELIDGSRHATSDYLELSKFADQYKHNLGVTRGQYEEGLDALHLFEKVLLQQQDFARYDFNASGNRLQQMRRRVCKDLNVALNELREAVFELVRRREGQVRIIDESLDVQRCELEMRKEMLDPSASRFATRVRELEDAKRNLLDEIHELRGALSRQETTSVELLRKHLPEEEITNVEEQLRVRDLQSRERMTDYRESVLASREATAASETGVAVARSQALRARQSGAPAALLPVLPATAPGTGSSSSSAVVPLAMPEPREIVGAERSHVALAMRQRSSRVTAVRDEISKALEGPYPKITATETAPTAAGTSSTGGDADGVKDGAAEESTGRQRRPIRVIGRDTS
jgi:hypothetical protein